MSYSFIIGKSVLKCSNLCKKIGLKCFASASTSINFNNHNGYVSSFSLYNKYNNNCFTKSCLSNYNDNNHDHVQKFHVLPYVHTNSKKSRNFLDHTIYSEGHRKSQGKTSSGYALPSFIIGASLFGMQKEKDPEKPENEDTLIWEIKLAKYSEHNKEFKKALDKYHSALAILQDRERSKEWDDARVLEARTFIYDNLANLSMSMGLLDQSEKLFKETLKGYLQMGNPKFSNAAVEISLKLAMIYAMQKRFDEADKGYNFCIETMHAIINSRRETKDEEKKEDSQTEEKEAIALLGMCYNSYSRFLYITEKYEPAELMLKASLNLATQSLGLDSPQIVTIHNDLAAIATARGNLDEALKQSKAAVDLAKKQSQEDLPQMVLNLGTVYLRRKEDIAAQTQCKEALKMAKKVKNEHIEKLAKDCIKDAKK